MRSYSTPRDSRLLVADDNTTILRVLRDTLGGPGTQVICAQDGRTALAEISRKVPDLIILDVNMPGMSGYEVCIALRKSFRTRHTPILMLTSREKELEQQHGLNMGADAYVTKPFDIHTLKSCVCALLRRSRESLDMNPLTHLPGNRAIMREVEQRLYDNESFVFTYVDIRHFKSFNDTYGFDCGDQLILATSELLCTAAQYRGARGFVGHIGGDDFALITQASVAQEELRRQFGEELHNLYTTEDLRSASSETPGMPKDSKAAPEITLTIGQVFCRPGHYRDFKAVARAASGFKERAKMEDPNRKPGNKFTGWLDARAKRVLLMATLFGSATLSLACSGMPRHVQPGFTTRDFAPAHAPSRVAAIDIQRMYQAGLDLYIAGRLSEAASKFQNILRVDPNKRAAKSALWSVRADMRMRAQVMRGRGTAARFR